MSGADGALVAIQRRAYSRIDGIAQALHECGVAQRQATADGRLHGLYRTHHKTGRAYPGEIHVAAEIIAVQPQRRRRAAAAAAIRLINHMILLQYFLCYRLIPVALKHQSDSNFRSSAKSF